MIIDFVVSQMTLSIVLNVLIIIAQEIGDKFTIIIYLDVVNISSYKGNNKKCW